MTPAEVKWDDMTPHQKGRYMHDVVTPKMREVFQAYDAEMFAKVSCGTCHGKNARERGFKMPSPDLPTLPSSEEVFMKTTLKEHPKMVAFMSEKVTPEMAKLLGEKAFDPKLPVKGAFSCEACHLLK